MYILLSPSKTQDKVATDAINFFTGLVFKQLHLADYNGQQMKYLYDHVIILSDKYGYLHAGDPVKPHRPELKVSQAKKLRPKVTRFLKKLNKPILNLASKEYSQLLAAEVEVRNLEFGRRPKTHIKKARGKILDYCIRNLVADPSEIEINNPSFWQK